MAKAGSSGELLTLYCCFLRGSGRRVFYLELLDLVCGCQEETVDKGVDFPAATLCSLFTGTVWNI